MVPPKVLIDSSGLLDRFRLGLRLKCSGFGRQFVGKHLGAIIPPIGERAIAFTCIVPGRFKATVDTTEHDGFGYHGHLVLGSRSLLLSLACQNQRGISVRVVTL